MIINESRRAAILEILQNGPKTAYKISLEMREFCSTGTVLRRLYELKAAKKVKDFGGLWILKP